jgi:bifunctional non-homologous end joining protein LigD
LRQERDRDRVRLFTRQGCDWTKRYPWIVEAALRNRRKQFVIDGDAVILGVDGRSDFDRALGQRSCRNTSLAVVPIWALTPRP